MNEALLLALAPYIVPPLVGVVFFLVRLVISKVDTKFGLVQHLVEAAVLATEQSHPELAGPDKKAAAEETIASLLAAAHVKADPKLIDTFIEAACAALNSGPEAPSTGMGFGR